MTKVEELKEKAEYSLVRDNGEKQSGYHFDTPKKLKAFEQAVREEEGEKHAKTENEWIAHLLSNVSNPDGAGSYLVDALEKTMEDNSRFLTQPTKEM